MLDKLVPDGTFLTTLERAILAAGSKYSGILYANTIEVFSVSAALMVTWHLYRGHLAHGSGGLGELLLPLMEKLLLIGIIAAMYALSPRLVQWIGEAASALAMTTGGSNAFDSVSVQMGKAITTMWQAWSGMPMWDPADPLSFSALASKLGAVLIVLLASVVVLFVAVIVLFVMLSGSVILAFATATGPLVWAFGLLRPMEFLINGWLKLVAVGFVTKLFAAICIEFAVSAVMTSLGPTTVPYSEALWKDPMNIFANLSQALAQLAIIAALVFAARSIAPMLVGGNAAIDLWGGMVNSVGMAAGAMRTVNTRGSGSRGNAGPSGGSSAGGTANGGGSPAPSGGGSGPGGGKAASRSGPPAATSSATGTPAPSTQTGGARTQSQGGSGTATLQPGNRFSASVGADSNSAKSGQPWLDNQGPPPPASSSKSQSDAASQSVVTGDAGDKHVERASNPQDGPPTVTREADISAVSERAPRESASRDGNVKTGDDVGNDGPPATLSRERYAASEPSAGETPSNGASRPVNPHGSKGKQE